MSKTYLIIGASSGIGLSLAKTLTSEGHKVIGTYNQTVNYPEVSGLTMEHLNVLEDNLNLSFIPEELDGIAYCPGSINLKPFKRIKPTDFENDYKLQVSGAIKIIQGSLPALTKSKEASIVLFSSIAVQNGFNFHTQVSSSKGAIEGLTRALSAELAPTVRVNCIAPSLTNTPLAKKLLNSEDKILLHGENHPLKRIGEPNDIAQTAKFLLSDNSSWITGQIIHVDGGKSRVR